MKIGFTKFTLLRPRNVRLISMSHRDFCLCPYCLNIKYKLLCVNRVAAPDDKIEDENSLINKLLCPKSDGYRFHDADCLLGKCEKCGDHETTLRNHYGKMDLTQLVTWNH